MGRIGGEQAISIGATCYRHGVIIHEILHALGFFHEHSRPDRDDYVTVDYTNVRDGMDHNFMKLTGREWFNMSIPYDTNSVLHYSGFAFAADRSIPSMVYKGTSEAVRAQRVSMSHWDTAQVCVAYRCDHCSITNSKFTCDEKVLSKTLLCDGTVDCDRGQDEHCYRPCCKAVQIDHANGERDFFIRNIIAEDDEITVKDWYSDKWGKNHLYNEK